MAAKEPKVIHAANECVCKFLTEDEQVSAALLALVE
jgi:hypothetical protein